MGKVTKAWFTLCVQSLPEVRLLLNVFHFTGPRTCVFALVNAKYVFWWHPMIIEFKHPVRCFACLGLCGVTLLFRCASHVSDRELNLEVKLIFSQAGLPLGVCFFHDSPPESVGS